MRFPCPWGEELVRINCSPKGELSAELTEGVNGLSAAPLRLPAKPGEQTLRFQNLTPVHGRVTAGLAGQAFQHRSLVVGHLGMAITLIQLPADFGVGGGVQLVAEKAGAREHDEDDGADDEGQLQPQDLLGGIRGARLGVVADQGQDVEGEEDRNAPASLLVAAVKA